ncbi:hypothetical protein GEMRC1_003741 [Eukaryota sp. GEM-RC1]
MEDLPHSKKRYPRGSILPGGGRVGNNAAELDQQTGDITIYAPSADSGIRHYAAGERMAPGKVAGPLGADVEDTTGKILWGEVEEGDHPEIIRRESS